MNENDLHARHSWMVGQKASLQAQLEGDPAFYDARIAGWWVWGISQWIGGEFCAGVGPWHRVDGRLVRTQGTQGTGIHRQRPHLSNGGKGIHRQLPHMISTGRGAHRLKNRGEALTAYFEALQARLRGVRTACGEWSRVCGDAVLCPSQYAWVGVFLDPPYGAAAQRDMRLYAEKTDVTGAVAAWCRHWEHDSRVRIALAGYEGEYPDFEARGWSVHAWKGRGGYGRNGTRAVDNASRERLWFSPHCLEPEYRQLALF